MNRRRPTWALIAGALVGGIATTLWIADRRWNDAIRHGLTQLRVRRETDTTDTRPHTRDELMGLPDPVVRYFTFALSPDQPLVSNAHVEQRGEFAMRADEWSPFSASEDICTDPPGFLWDARIRMAAVLPFFIRDGYVGGEGRMEGRLAAVVPVVRQRGTSAMASGELLRYLAEAVLVPTALLPRNGIAWTAIDDDNARLTLKDGTTTVSCSVRFGERGEILRIEAMRYRDTGATSELTPWVGHWSDYADRDGMMIPLSGEVEWIMPGGPAPYFRCRITNTHYNFAGAPLAQS